MLFNILKTANNFIPDNYVTIIAPTTWQYIYGDSITVEWELFPGASLYKIRLEEYAGSLIEEKTTSDLNCTFTSISDGQYTIKVRAEREFLYTDWRSVSCEIENLAAPTISMPSEAEQVVAIGGLPYDVSMECSALAWADYYQRQVATDSGFTNIVSDQEFAPGLPLDASLNAYSTYYMRVRGKVGSTYGPWSDTRSFSLISE